MNRLSCLGDILSDFRYLFNQQNFALFQAFIFGFIANRGNGTLTDFINRVVQRGSIGLFRSAFPGGNGTPMLSLEFSSDASNTILPIGFMSMMKPKP